MSATQADLLRTEQESPSADAGRSGAPIPELSTVLDGLAQTIVEQGTSIERQTLEHLSAAAQRASPGAAAALVDWSGSEAARLRAYGVVHGIVLALPTSEQLSLRARMRRDVIVAGARDRGE
jgi:hypothetical protein